MDAMLTSTSYQGSLRCWTFAPAGIHHSAHPSSSLSNVSRAATRGPAPLQTRSTASRPCVVCSSQRNNPQPGRRPNLPKPASLWGKQPSKQPIASTSSRKPTPKGSNRRFFRFGGPPSDDEEEESTWDFLDWQQYGYRWEVPWGPATTVGGMALWFFSFVAVGLIAVPGLYKYAGLDITQLDAQQKALFTLATQALETVVGLAVIRVVTVKSLEAARSNVKNKAPDPTSDLFDYSLKGAFQAPKGWAVWATLGVICAPVVVGATASLVAMAGWNANVGGRGTVDGVAGMIDVDLSSYLSLLVVTGVLAPVLEETVFRGFLLPSLTKSMPTWAAIVVSSLAFGAAHLSMRDLPVLCALGAMLGLSYVRSRNLLTPIVIHGAWNSAVLTLLFGLAASGVNVEQALHELR